jgi:diguanylate cyclase (GGDEF)-like protein
MDDSIRNLVDLELWKKIQDEFARSINGTVFSIDNQGKELFRSSDFPLFCQMIHEASEGMEFCRNCWLDYMEKLGKEQILFCSCPAGLLNIMVPIKIKDNIFGAVICCSLVKNARNFAELRNVSRILKIEYQELVDALNKIPVSKEDELKLFGTLLATLSLTLPEVAHQKHLSEKKLSQLTILQKISQLITSSLELEKILKIIIGFMIDSLYVDDCSIIILDDNKKLRYSFKESVMNYKDIEQEAIDEITSTKNISLHQATINGKIEIVLSIPLKVRGNLIGIMNLYSSSSAHLEEKEFLAIAADQVSIAIDNAKHFNKIVEIAVTDKLTGLYNRRYFFEVLKQSIAKNLSPKRPLTVTLIDIDHFKHYNDVNGHVKGDNVLSEIAGIIKNSVRPADTTGRYGGEEFIVISPETPNNDALVLIENLRKAVEEYSFEAKEKQPNQKITISAGIVSCMDKSLTVDDIIKEADKALYKAKNKGRNTVVSTIILDKNLKPIDVKEI